MTEQQLQSKIVVWFSQTFPDRRGCLFLVNNDSFNVRDKMKKKALGLISGVSDLVYVYNGIICGIEIKAPGSRHNSDHVRNQIEWGEMIQRSGGFYIISSDQEEIKNFIKHPYHFDLEKIKGRLNKSTILF